MKVCATLVGASAEAFLGGTGGARVGVGVAVKVVGGLGEEVSSNLHKKRLALDHSRDSSTSQN